MITINALPVFTDNYIWLISHLQHPYVIIVDPGDGDAVMHHCQAHGLVPLAILITHHHWDHSRGIITIKQHHDIPVYGPAHEQIDHITHPLVEGDLITFKELSLEFKIIDTPGHTAGHICYYGHGTLFCGDTLFAAGCGRLFEGTPTQMQRSLAKIRALPDDTLIYCAHEYTLDNLNFARIAEPDNQAIIERQQHTQALRANKKPSIPSRLSIEKQTNPFLRWDQTGLIEAASHYQGTPLKTPAEVFAAVRQWKDDLD